MSMLLNLIKRKKTKQKIEEVVLGHFFSTIIFTFYKYRNIKGFAKHSFDWKQNYLIKFNDKLEIFYYNTEEVKWNNKAQKKDLEKWKVVINTAFNLYDKLLNIHETQHDKLSEDVKKRISVLNRPENLTLDFDEGDLLPIMSCHH